MRHDLSVSDLRFIEIGRVVETQPVFTETEFEVNGGF